jgi:N-acetylgalactosamine kinase
MKNRIPPALLALADRFASVFGERGGRQCVFAPGRVNIIGEHTDYAGYPVLPIAIQRGIRVVCAPRGDSRIVLRNADPAFAAHEFTLEDCAVPFAKGDWGNYVKAALRGCIEEGVVEKASLRGFNALYEGDLPVAAGLSSSSALVVSTGLAFLALNDVAMPRIAFAELMARSERFTGTQGGGMDQAASMLGSKGHAVKIDFLPLRAEPVAIPRGWRFVVADSLVPAPKSADAQTVYNTRVFECRVAAALIARRFDRRYDDLAALRLSDVAPERVGVAARVYDAEVDRLLPRGAVTFEVIAALAGSHRATALAAERERILPGVHTEESRYRVRDRYLHVVSEARRVTDAVAAMREKNIARCGALLDASHAGCRDLYEVSSPVLERLVRIGKQAGAAGSRLTGAGFGGCTVHLVEDAKADDILHAFRTQFYHHEAALDAEDLDRRLFIAEPSGGAWSLALDSARRDRR